MHIRYLLKLQFNGGTKPPCGPVLAVKLDKSEPSTATTTSISAPASTSTSTSSPLIQKSVPQSSVSTSPTLVITPNAIGIMSVMETRILSGGQELQIAQGDLTAANTDAIVHPTNALLSFGGQVGEHDSIILHYFFWALI